MAITLRLVVFSLRFQVLLYFSACKKLEASERKNSRNWVHTKKNNFTRFCQILPDPSDGFQLYRLWRAIKLRFNRWSVFKIDYCLGILENTSKFAIPELAFRLTWRELFCVRLRFIILLINELFSIPAHLQLLNRVLLLKLIDN